MARISDRVGHHVRALSREDIARLPGSCGGCLFWELGTACPSPRTTSIPGWSRIAMPRRPAEHKAAWIADQETATGPPGRVIEVDGEVVAYALFAPSSAFARPGPTVPRASRDALLLATLWVRPTEREAGIGRRLVRSAIKDAIRLHLPAVEAYGDRRFLDRACLLPAQWLLHAGFRVQSEHPRTPLFRLEVRRALRWSDPLEHAWEEVLGRLPQRLPAREPAQPSVRQSTTRRSAPG
jgi:GNAT superfamily N-acetyltransferase